MVEDTKTKSIRKEPPRLVIITHEDGSVQGVVTADTVSVECPAASVFDYMMFLFGAYYAWGLNFPRAYQLLSFLQIHVLRDEGELDTAFRGSALVKLEKALHL